MAESYRPEDWLSASETIRLVRSIALSSNAHIDITKRARAGLLRARADLTIINGSQRRTDTEVATGFWWAEGGAELTQNWEIGDFETSVGSKVIYQVFGVKFHREDVGRMIPDALRSEPKSPPSPKDSVGRPMSALWSDWVAELAALVHDEGIPSAGNTELLIRTVANRLAERGLEAPTRSTVQDAARAVLRRLRDSGN